MTETFATRTHRAYLAQSGQALRAIAQVIIDDNIRRSERPQDDLQLRALRR